MQCMGIGTVQLVTGPTEISVVHFKVGPGTFITSISSLQRAVTTGSAEGHVIHKATATLGADNQIGDSGPRIVS